MLFLSVVENFSCVYFSSLYGPNENFFNDKNFQSTVCNRDVVCFVKHTALCIMWLHVQLKLHVATGRARAPCYTLLAGDGQPTREKQLHRVVCLGTNHTSAVDNSRRHITRETSLLQHYNYMYTIQATKNTYYKS